MRIGSLFSGIGGLELGLEWAGVGETVWQVEQDEYCRRVLARHWPNATRYDDVRTVGVHNLESVDVICGGFPCQDISYAGKGAGLAGERSGLWFEFARIVRELGPEYVVVENGAALLGRGLDTLLGDLADSGYDAEWSCVQACDVGAPHERDRTFIVAWRTVADAACDDVARRGHSRADQRHAERVSAIPEGRESDVADSGVNYEGRGSSRLGRRRAFTESHTPECGRNYRPADVQWLAEPDVGRVVDGLPCRVERVAALGNAVVPQVAEVVGRRLHEIALERESSTIPHTTDQNSDTSAA